MTDKNPLAHYSGVLSEAVQESAAANLPASGAAALGEYLKDCEEHLIVPDVGGAFAFAFAAGFNLATSLAAPDESYPALPSGDYASAYVSDAKVFSESEMRAYVDADRARRQAAPAAVAVPDEQERRKLKGLMLEVWACAKPHPDVTNEQLRGILGRCLPYIRELAATPAAAAPLPLLVRDIARELGITCAEACIALKPLGNFSTNTAVTAEMMAKLRECFPERVPASEVAGARERMTVGRACYFMERFLKEEKLLGPNEQAALHYVIDMLEAAAAPVAQTEATWCEYIAGMIGCYLKEPDESPRVKAIAGIIERRLWALPSPKPMARAEKSDSFEAWAKAEGGPFALHNCGPYNRDAMKLAGMAWHAGALLAGVSAPAAQPERKYISPVRTIADLVNNLMLMDQALPIYGAQYIEHPAGKRRAIAVPPTVSIERVKDSRWIGEGEALNTAIIWTRAEQPAAQACIATLTVDSSGNIDYETAQAGWLLPEGGYPLYSAPQAQADALDALTDSALLDAMERQRIALHPEYEGPWDAAIYNDDGQPNHRGTGSTPREAIRAAIAAQTAQQGGSA